MDAGWLSFAKNKEVGGRWTDMIGGLGGRSQSCSDEQPLRMAFRKYTFAWHLVIFKT